MRIDAYDIILKKLRESTEPLSIERQKKLADLLDKYRTHHDEKLWLDAVIRPEKPQIIQRAQPVPKLTLENKQQMKKKRETEVLDEFLKDHKDPTLPF
jgi:hypothetical protein